ncbi:flagellar biosynthetic protein FliO [Idiomarina tyrosinivorans]|nr:flagellar biosynthetic protein FliO [Idiomarina tyrosinivorans]
MTETADRGVGVITANDYGAMLLSLLLVLAVIIGLAMLVKRLNLKLQNGSGIEVMSSVSLGAKERLVVVKVGDDKLLLGVTSQSVNVLKELPEGFAVTATAKPETMTLQNIWRFARGGKTTKDNNIT